MFFPLTLSITLFLFLYSPLSLLTPLPNHARGKKEREKKKHSLPINQDIKPLLQRIPAIRLLYTNKKRRIARRTRQRLLARVRSCPFASAGIEVAEIGGLGEQDGVCDDLRWVDDGLIPAGEDDFLEFESWVCGDKNG